MPMHHDGADSACESSTWNRSQHIVEAAMHRPGLNGGFQCPWMPDMPASGKRCAPNSWAGARPVPCHATPLRPPLGNASPTGSAPSTDSLTKVAQVLLGSRDTYTIPVLNKWKQSNNYGAMSPIQRALNW
jgi:hypothetical protein